MLSYQKTHERRSILLLVIGKSRSDANAVSDIFNYMGIVSHGTTPDLASYEFSNRHRAVIFIHPEEIGSIDELIRSARAYSLNSLIFAIRPSGEVSSISEREIYSRFDEVFSDEDISSDMLCRIINAQGERGKPTLGSYRLAGLDASVNLDAVSYFDTRVTLTKTETMILRFLIASYPVKRSSRDVLKYAFRSGKISEPAGIRAHICSINAKLLSAVGKHTVVSDRGLGYYLGLNDEENKIEV